MFSASPGVFWTCSSVLFSHGLLGLLLSITCVIVACLVFLLTLSQLRFQNELSHPTLGRCGIGLTSPNVTLEQRSGKVWAQSSRKVWALSVRKRVGELTRAPLWHKKTECSMGERRHATAVSWPCATFEENYAGLNGVRVVLKKGYRKHFKTLPSKRRVQWELHWGHLLVWGWNGKSASWRKGLDSQPGEH